MDTTKEIQADGTLMRPTSTVGSARCYEPCGADEYIDGMTWV